MWRVGRRATRRPGACVAQVNSEPVKFENIASVSTTSAQNWWLELDKPRLLSGIRWISK